MAASVTATFCAKYSRHGVRACMDTGQVKGEGFAVDASVMEANASRYHGKVPGEIDWSVPGAPQTNAVPPSSWPGSMMKIRTPTTNHRSFDFAQRSLLGLDGQGQQASAVRLRALLHLPTSRTRDHCRCRAHAGKLL